MTSFTTRLGGYLKQLVGEVVGRSGASRKKASARVVGAPAGTREPRAERPSFRRRCSACGQSTAQD